MAKTKDDGLRVVEVTFGNRGGGSNMAFMSPVDGGIRVSIQPSDKVGGEIKSRGVQSIKAQWRVDADGQPKWLDVTPAKAGERSTKGRYKARGTRTHLFRHVGGRGGKGAQPG